MKKTKLALLQSVISLLLCVSMLMGTTFAWFTDTVSSEGNIIASGTLQAGLEWTDTVGGTWQDASEGAISTTPTGSPAIPRFVMCGSPIWAIWRSGIG